ncbi:M23 family metallopeptidase [Fodinisporobacter ferrooxydans]|uniref:M23 family metallopeptidase n=1 Tax=Fodinisporobacter ferrooxydans TaxID=2901836 RepID=A0ABY4CUG8_9BACL|nr:M23 family metallopeptidase [Alicyclobacillaceae bacterium MYW30-H2]
MNNQEKEKNQNSQENTSTSRKTTHQSGRNKFFSKRWAFPVMYLAAAGLIISLMYVKTNHQASNPPSDVAQNTQTQTQTNQNSAPANPSAAANAAPSFQWPVGPDAANASVVVGYYDETSTDAKAQAAALVNYDNHFYTHNGIDIQAQNDATFTVLAAAAGQVTNVEDNPLNGQTVEITHPDGYVTVYASLGKVDVNKGDQVTQGQPIGDSGYCKFEASAKNHLYFEVRKDGQVINPASVLPAKANTH